MNLWQMSFSGAVLILAVIVVRAAALHKLPKRFFLLLWGIVLVRLLIPYSIPSVFSVYSLWARLALNKGTANCVPTARITAAAQNGTGTAAYASPPPVPEIHVDPWLLIWLIGTLACLIFFSAAYCKCRRKFQASIPVENETVKRWLSECSLRRPLAVRQSDRISTPLTYGVLQPVILLPKTMNWNDTEALQYVLAHEYVHIRRFDALGKLLLAAALCIHWFNPMVWVMNVLANRDIEISCDETVILKSGSKLKSTYAKALIRMEECRNNFAPFTSGYSKNAIEERIIAIMKLKKTSAFTMLAAAVLAVGIGAAFATSALEPQNPVQNAAAWTGDENNEVQPVEGYGEYEPFGITLDEKENALYYKGEKVMYFQDSVYLGDGGRVSRCEYFCEDGTISLQTVRRSVQNPDGSVDPFGPILRLQTLNAEDAELRIEEYLSAGLEAVTYAEDDTADTEELLKVYTPFGLEYRIDPVTFEVRMEYEGKPVHSVNDSQTGIWIANNLRGSELGPDAIDLEAVYENGELTGLRESDVPHIIQHSTAEATASSGEEVNEGKTFTELFDKYAPYGISYEEKETADGTERSLYWNGKAVNHFSDVSPDGGVFTLDSSRQSVDGLSVSAVYENGKLAGVKQKQ